MSSLRLCAALTATVLALSLSADAQVAPDAVLLRTPDVSKDKICFRYDGDVWLVDKHGGQARRQSSVPGNESFPRFSPDGQSLAFMGGYQGGSDLYGIGIEGGVPRRLTHHPASEFLCDWLPGGEAGPCERAAIRRWRSARSAGTRAPTQPPRYRVSFSACFTLRAWVARISEEEIAASSDRGAHERTLVS